MLDNIYVGKQIAALRKKHGFTQEEIAARLGISAQAISKWENGHTLPETAMLPLLAELLECSIDSLLIPFLTQDRSFREFADAVGGAAGELAVQLYNEMKRRFEFTLEFNDKFYVFDNVTDGASVVFKNPNKDDFIIRMDAKPQLTGSSGVFVRLSLTNCSKYMHKIERLPEHVKKVFRCSDCNSCTCDCPYLMKYTFEGKAYLQCHFVTITLDSTESMEHILTLVSAEQAVYSQ